VPGVFRPLGKPQGAGCHLWDDLSACCWDGDPRLLHENLKGLDAPGAAELQCALKAGRPLVSVPLISLLLPVSVLQRHWLRQLPCCPHSVLHAALMMVLTGMGV
jgi:hypothetical protein